MSELKVVTLHESNYRDPVATLRIIADQIEAGEHGEVGCVAVVVLGDELSVFGMGPDAEGPSVHYVLCGGARKLESALLEHGQEN